jgi:hypothetical protein
MHNSYDFTPHHSFQLLFSIFGLWFEGSDCSPFIFSPKFATARLPSAGVEVRPLICWGRCEKQASLSSHRVFGPTEPNFSPPWFCSAKGGRRLAAIRQFWETIFG